MTEGKKRYFILNVQPVVLDQKYRLIFPLTPGVPATGYSPEAAETEQPPSILGRTMLQDLNGLGAPSATVTVTPLNSNPFPPTAGAGGLQVVMRNYLSKARIPSLEEAVQDGLCCWWCRQPILEGEPVGCPLRFLGKNTEIECEGIFCTHNCTLAYIESNSHSSRYRLSEMLLRQLSPGVTAAPHWTMLRSFGGSLSPEEYRRSMNSIKFIDTVFDIRCLRPIGRVYEEQYAF